MSDAAIDNVWARRIWDSRGRPTVEVEITTTDGFVGISAAPAGASTGSGEAIDLRDGGSSLGGHDVQTAVGNIIDRIAPAIQGLPVSAQDQIDHAMQRLDGTETCSNLGGNAMIATSMAVAHAAAKSAHQPLWQYFAQGGTPALPVPEVQIFGGGAHALGAIDLQDFMIVPFGASSFREAMEWTAEIYLAAGQIMQSRGAICGVADEGGYWPVFKSNEHAIETLVLAIERAGFSCRSQVAISLDIAATQFYEDGTYQLRAEQRALDTENWLATLSNWLNTYPIAMIEDPFHEHDISAHAELTQRFGNRLQIVADDLTVTSSERVREVSRSGACSALLCKPNQAGTLTRAREAFEAAQTAGWSVIISARSGETEDTTISHLAVGWASGQCKVGSFARSERMAKWNEVLRIEERLGSDAKYAGRKIFPWLATEPLSGESPR